MCRLVISPVYLLLYLALPKENGTYLYLIMCWICLRTVRSIRQLL